jgi:hypothetical protein
MSRLHPIGSKKRRQPLKAASTTNCREKLGAKTYRPKRSPLRFRPERATPGSGKNVEHQKTESGTGRGGDGNEAQQFEGFGVGSGFHGLEIFRVDLVWLADVKIIAI